MARNDRGTLRQFAVARGDCTTISDSTTEAVSASLSIPAGALNVGDRIELIADAEVVAGTIDTQDIRLKFGGVTVASTGSMVLSTSDVAALRAELMVTATGLAGTAALDGHGLAQAGTGNQVLTPVSDSSTLDTTEDVAVEVAVQHDGTSGNQTQARNLHVRLYPSTE